MNVQTPVLKPAAEVARAAPTRIPNESAEYRAARTALLAEEIELRRHIERVAAQRFVLVRAALQHEVDLAERGLRANDVARAQHGGRRKATGTEARECIREPFQIPVRWFGDDVEVTASRLDAGEHERAAADDHELDPAGRQGSGRED